MPRTPAASAALLAFVRDPDPEVRRSAGEAVPGWDGPGLDATRELLVPARDPHPDVRGVAAEAPAASRDDTCAVADALAALLGEDDRSVRLAAAHGLARRDDPRTAEAIERVGPLGPVFAEDHRARGLWSWKRERERHGHSG
ncbi:HEAT repeat domain-containing protein [Streptomyces sp. Tue6028]|uniref:HEAT repeat domain-containing protein n=1 Tax=Streptomyces sp. Tue6028 TaxID=2036037 RepID=UPI003D744FFD